MNVLINVRVSVFFLAILSSGKENAWTILFFLRVYNLLSGRTVERLPLNALEGVTKVDARTV